MRFGRVLAASAALLVWSGASAAPAHARAEDAGPAVIVRAGDPSEELERGGSADEFTLRLPHDASCPGDSANDGYRIQTFIIPAVEDPGALTYESIKPAGDGRWGLYQPDSRPFVQGLTEMNQGPGEPGRIGGLPVFTFAIYPPRLFEDGEYRIGVACTSYNETERFWHTTIALTNDRADEPAQVRWRVASAPVQADDDDPDRSIALALLAIGLGSAGAALVLRRSSRAGDPSNTTTPRQAQP